MTSGFTKVQILEGLDACEDFECGRCPYKKYDNHDYMLRCVHMLISDLHDLMFEEDMD